MVGVGTGSDGTTSKTFSNAGDTGGEYNHKLTVSEMPSHRHSFALRQANGSYTGYVSEITSGVKYDYVGGTLSSGGDGSHNNIQPYVTVYYWKRTA